MVCTVLDQIRHAAILETAGKPLDQPNRPVDSAEQQRAGVRGHLAAVESSDHRAPVDRCKTK